MTQAQDRVVRRLLAAEEEGWLNLVMVGEVLCCVQPMAFTWGLVVGIDPFDPHNPYLRRYCYEHREDAMAAVEDFKDPLMKHAPGPWIKCKGQWGGQYVDLLNPELFHPNQFGVMVRDRETPQPKETRDEQESTSA